MPNIVEITIRTIDKTKEGVSSATSGFQSLGKVAGATMLGVGVAAAAAAVKGVMAFTDFQSSMNEVFTLLPGISQDAMSDMTDQVKQFSKDFGVLPEKVVPALYQSLSAGVPPGNVFDFLETAQKAAKGGVTDLETAVDGLSSVVNAYGADTINAAKASDIMFTTVRFGKTTMGELSKSLFNVIPTASALGVKFEDVGAALAAMTAQGVPTSVATTQLRQLFVELSKSTGTASEKFKELSGKTFKDFVVGGGNVQQALQIMEKGAQKTGLGINDLFGSVEAGNAALSLTGKGTETFSNDLKAMGDSAGATDQAFKTMNQGLGPLFDKIKSFGQVALINFGQLLAPIVEEAGKKFLDLGTKFQPAFDAVKEFGKELSERLAPALDEVKSKGADAFKWAEGKPEVLAAVGGVVGTVLVGAFYGLATAAWSAAAGVAAALWPVLLVAAAIGGLVAALTYAWNNWETFREVVTTVLNWLKENGPKAFELVSAAARLLIEQFLAPMIGYIQQNGEVFALLGKGLLILGGILLGIVVVAVGAVIAAFLVLAVVIGIIAAAIAILITFLYKFIQVIWDVFNNIRDALGAAIDWIENLIQTIWDMVNNVATAFANVVRAVWLGIQVFNDLAQNVGSAIGDAIRWVWNLIQVVWDMAQNVGNAIGAAVNWFYSLPGRILGAVGDLGGLLFSAGRSVIDGLIRGIESGIGRLKSLLASVTKLIPLGKGPLDKDQRLLHPAGQGIMQGLMGGIDSQVPALRRQLQGVTLAIPEMAGNASATGSAGALAGGGVTINNYIAGSIRSDRDLIQLIRREFDNRGLGRGR